MDCKFQPCSRPVVLRVAVNANQLLGPCTGIGIRIVPLGAAHRDVREAVHRMPFGIEPRKNVRHVLAVFGKLPAEQRAEQSS